MNVVHVSASITSSSGGIGPVILNVASRSEGYGIHSSIVTYDEPFSTYDAYQNLDIYKCKLIGLLRIGFSPEMKSALADLRDCNIIHSHGLWLRNSYYARREAEKRNLPLVISPHGMLEPYALSRSKLKKKLISYLYEEQNLERANCLQAASMQEAINIKNLGLKNDVAVIPFGVDVPNYVRKDSNYLDQRYPDLQDKKVMLFLSRIHPKKGLSSLIEAWGRLYKKFPEWRLVVAGPDEGGYMTEIQKIIDSKGLGGYVTYIGEVLGDKKNDCYSRAEIFVLPTLSENYGFVVPEALSFGCPVITTKGTPWNDLEKFQCGWWIETGVEPLITTLEKSLSMDDVELKMMGANGKAMVESSYSWSGACRKFKELYEWISASSSKPDFVI